MDASEPMLKGMAIEQENDVLNFLFWDCEAFLLKWNAYEPQRNEKSSDAMVAIMTLQKQVVDRRAYILELFKQEKLPF